jgi:hypothetical protein
VCVCFGGYARLRVPRSICDHVCTGLLCVPTLVTLLNKSSRLVVLTMMNGIGRMMSCMTERRDYVSACDKTRFISTKEITTEQTRGQEMLSASCAPITLSKSGTYTTTVYAFRAGLCWNNILHSFWGYPVQISVIGYLDRKLLSFYCFSLD